jgi:HEAT repeat protein
MNCLNDPDAIARGFAAVALAAQQEQSALPVIQQMVATESDAFVRSHLLNAVDKLGQRAWVIAYATRVLTDESFTNRDRQAVIQVVVRFNDPATADLLLAVYAKHEPGVAQHALDGLRACKDPRAVDLLLAQLQDDSPQKRAAAAYELGNFGDPRAVEPIKRLVGDNAIAWTGDRPGEPSTSVGQTARDALKKLNSQAESGSEGTEKKQSRWKLW